MPHNICVAWGKGRSYHLAVELGKVTWEDPVEIDRIRRTYAQNHVGLGKQN